MIGLETLPSAPRAPEGSTTESRHDIRFPQTVEIVWESCGWRIGKVTAQVMTAVATNPWDQIKAKLAARISSQAYEDWVVRTLFEGADGGALMITVPDQATKEWMEQEYAQDVREPIRELNLAVEKVIYAPQARAATP